MTNNFEAKTVEGAKYYVAQTATNYEKRVQTLVREQVLLQHLEDFVEDVIIPTEQVVEVKKGEKTTSDRKFFPGYVLIKCVMNDRVWHMIRNIPHVSSFLGAERGQKPLPLSNREAEAILKQMAEGLEKPRTLATFEVGEEVRITDGSFNGFQGMIEEVDVEKERLHVSVSIFGRATPIEIDFAQVEKV